MIVIGCRLLSSCRSQQGTTKPSIKFTKVPLAEDGGTRKLYAVEGQVIGAHAGQPNVLLARSGAWDVQPYAEQPFTEIQADSKWKNSTHLGTEYAARLVEPEYRPPVETDVLPGEGDGVVALAIEKGEVKILVPLFWQTWWFQFSCLMVGVLAILVLYRFRLHQLTRQLQVRFEERLAERTRKGFLSASMQLHVGLDQLPANPTAKPQLNRVLQLMRQVIDEGRNAVTGLRSSEPDSDDLAQAFSRIQQELAVKDQVRFRVIVKGQTRPLHPIIRDEVYRIGREALINAFRHSQARSIEVEVEYTRNDLRIFVLDDGCGIDPQVLRSSRDGHRGLSGMRERAEVIGARLKVSSRAAVGTEVELAVPGSIAFQNQSSHGLLRWGRKWVPPKAETSLREATRREPNE